MNKTLFKIGYQTLDGTTRPGLNPGSATTLAAALRYGVVVPQGKSDTARLHSHSQTTHALPYSTEMDLSM